MQCGMMTRIAHLKHISSDKSSAAQQLLRWLSVPEQSGLKTAKSGGTGAAVPLSEGAELGPHLTQCCLGRRLPPYEVAP